MLPRGEMCVCRKQKSDVELELIFYLQNKLEPRWLFSLSIMWPLSLILTIPVQYSVGSKCGILPFCMAAIHTVSLSNTISCQGNTGGRWLIPSISNMASLSGQVKINQQINMLIELLHLRLVVKKEMRCTQGLAIVQSTFGKTKHLRWWSTCVDYRMWPKAPTDNQRKDIKIADGEGAGLVKFQRKGNNSYPRVASCP